MLHNNLVTFILALACGVLPTLLWLMFWLEEDRKRPEPTGLLIRAFIAGGLAVVAAYYLELAAQSYLGKLPDLHYSAALTAPVLFGLFWKSNLLVAWALIEETLKFVITYFAVLKNKHFDEPIDAMIYMITAALGFAAVENTLFLLDVVSKGEGLSYFLLTGNLRFLGATVVHLVSSAIVGAAIALAFCSPKRDKFVYITGGLFLATILHTLFNFFIMIDEGKAMFQVLLLLWIAGLFVIFLFEKVKHVVCNSSVTTTFLKVKHSLHAKR